jgi:RNA polymerase sigma-70 factor (ECF subfamily)
MQVSVDQGPPAEHAGAATQDLEAVYRASGPALWRAVYAFAGGRRTVADDAVAEAFARALASRTEIRDPPAWLYRTAFRIAAAELRAERHRAAPRDTEVQPPAEPVEVIQALRELSPSQRAAVVLHHEADLPVREVARLMGTSVAAVKVHLFRGRRRLRELLGSEEVDDA